MPLAAPLIESALSGVPRLRQGKVRDLYLVGDDVLIVATDRISAFDYVLGSGIPDKGRVLTQLSAFWFARTGGIVAEPRHHRRRRPTSRRCSRADADQLRGRAMLVRRTTPLPIECVARGYLSGSGWKDYVATGAVCGIALPAGLRESDRLPDAALHARHQGRQRPRHQHQRGRRRRRSSAPTCWRGSRRSPWPCTRTARRTRPRCGILLADTKFEFGLTDGGELLLIDEAMTPGLVALLAAPISTRPAARNRASTSSTCATTSSRSAGTSSRRCRRCPTTSCGGRGPSTWTLSRG